MNFVVFGSPGAGKGTLAEFLRKKYRFVHVASGDLLRSEVEKNSAIGKKVKPLLDEGRFVDEEIIVDLVLNKIKEIHMNHQLFFLDNFPQSIIQVNALENFFEEMNIQNILRIILEVDCKIALDRMIHRRSCFSCGKVYNVKTLPPKIADLCDICSRPLSYRGGDRPEFALKRLEAFVKMNREVIKYYKESNLTSFFDTNHPLEICLNDYEKYFTKHEAINV